MIKIVQKFNTPTLVTKIKSSTIRIIYNLAILPQNFVEGMKIYLLFYTLHSIHCIV